MSITVPSLHICDCFLQVGNVPVMIHWMCLIDGTGKFCIQRSFPRVGKLPKKSL